MLVRRMLGRQTCRPSLVGALTHTRQFSELHEMKQRIEAIKATSQICSAMQSIAAAKIAACERAAIQFRGYSACVEPFWKTETDHSADVKKVLLVPVSSNRGLCGGVNTGIKRQFQSMIPKLEKAGIKYDFFFIGDRTRRAFQSSHGTGQDMFRAQISGLDNMQMITYDTSLEIVDRFFDEKLKYDKMIIVYNFYVSKVKYECLVKEFYSKDIALKDTAHIEHYECDDMDLHKDNMYNLALASGIHEAIAESLASEQSSRMMAMDNATKNCDEMVAEMTLAFNGMRQAEVTSELLEVISGMKAVLAAQQ